MVFIASLLFLRTPFGKNNMLKISILNYFKHVYKTYKIVN